jgi:two-component system phosphate regulon sensor histidine kinase PhoR
MFRTIRWRIALPYTVLAVLVMAAMVFAVLHLVRQTYLDGIEAQLTAEGLLIGDAFPAAVPSAAPGPDMDAFARRNAGLLGARVTIIGTDGTVLGESTEDRAQMDNHLYRPEVQQALDEGSGTYTRYSRTMGLDMMYVAVLASFDGATDVVVRVALPLRDIEPNLARLRTAVLAFAALSVVAAGALAPIIAARITRPVRTLTSVAQRMAKGDLEAHIFPTTHDEVGTLTKVFSNMADQLRHTIGNLSEEQTQLEAVLNNMADGVIITDHRARVTRINRAAAQLLGTDPSSAIGRSFARVVRDHRIVAMMRKCTLAGEKHPEPITLERMGLFLQVIARTLPVSDPPACLIILQDLTRLHKLESIRRDFISSISHELRTPLSSLKALADTLQAGALDDPPAARRFAERIENEVDDLAQMVEELLELARIESGRAPLDMVPTAVPDIILEPVARLQPLAERAGLQLSVHLPRGLPPVQGDVERLQRVVTNLVHNAIKFTPSGGNVSVSAEAADDEVLVHVTDTGVGISPEDLPRVFERFYKADRARSGGGTGLGLAIARHIIQAHAGRISAESTQGKGSTFTFTLPTARGRPRP